VGCGLWAVGCGLWAVGCGLWAVGCGLWAGEEKGLYGLGCTAGDLGFLLMKEQGSAAEGRGGRLEVC